MGGVGGYSIVKVTFQGASINVVVSRSRVPYWGPYYTERPRN